MSSDPNKQQGQYPPPQWDAPRGAYPIPQQSPVNYRAPPQSQHPYQNPSTPGQQGDMVTLPPPQHQPPPDYYRHPPYDMYPGHPHDPQRAPPPPHHMYPQHQPAPRQRTAIACRYCRRRKIRCSGFEASEDGRCTNCQRFQQECIFTPVSAHASAFVPAHTAYPHLRNAAPIPQRGGGRPLYPHQQGPPPAIYGAHGQPLGMPMPGQDPNYPPPPHGYPSMASPSHPYPGPMYDDRGPPPPGHPKDQVSRKRPRPDESPNPPTAPPPPPQESSSHPYHHEQGRPSAPSGRRGSGGGYEYPDPTGLVPVSPASSVTSYQSAPYSQPPGQQPYYPAATQTVRRSSPQSSSYSYEQRASGSPHGSTSSASAFNYVPAGLHPPQVLPPRDNGRTPPPRNNENAGNGSGQRGKMGIHDLLGPGEQSGGRTSADSSMVKALDRKGM